MKRTRNSNIEILRIISMLFIVISHYTVHKGVLNASLPISFNRILLEITTLGNIGVILFVLISGYFMIEQKRLKFKKIISLYLQIVFYSLGIYIIFMLLGLESFSVKEFIKSVFPITFGAYWFMSCYMILYLLSPFINKFLNGLSRAEYLKYLLLMVFIFSILTTVTTKSFYGNELIQFILFYSIGAYFKKYPKNIFNNDKLNKWLLLLTSLLLVLSTVFFCIIGTRISIFNLRSSYFFDRTSFLALLFSLSIFNIFINRKQFNNKLINIIGSCTLGIYLIHDNFLIRSIIWSDLFIMQNT